MLVVAEKEEDFNTQLFSFYDTFRWEMRNNFANLSAIAIVTIFYTETYIYINISKCCAKKIQ
jgi:hypothetical protein